MRLLWWWILVCGCVARRSEGTILAMISRGESFLRSTAHSRASMHAVPEQYDAVRSHSMYLLNTLKKELGADKTVIYLESAKPHLESILKVWYAPHKTHALLAEDIQETISLHADDMAAVVILRSNAMVPSEFGQFIENEANLDKVIYADFGMVYLPGAVIQAHVNFLHFQSLDLEKLQHIFGAGNVTAFTP